MPTSSARTLVVAAQQAGAARDTIRNFVTAPT
jgi:hypothetical protein